MERHRIGAWCLAACLAIPITGTTGCATGGFGFTNLDAQDDGAERGRGGGGGGQGGGGQGGGGQGGGGPVVDVSGDLFDLGQALAFDKILSGNQDISCLTCHHPQLGTDDDRALPAGAGASGLGADRSLNPVIGRQAPPLFNLAQQDGMFWDSRVEIRNGNLVTPAGDQITPEMEAVFDFGVVSAQAMFPVTSPAEMRGLPGENELGDIADDDLTAIWEGLMARLGDIPEYVTMFEAAYPGTDFDDMSFAHAANAIAGFEIAAFTFNDSPWQRFLRGDQNALTPAQEQGRQEFNRSNCDRCHQGPLLSDFNHHNTGVPQLGPGTGDGPFGHDDFGRFGVTGDNDDLYAFRTPLLLNVELTGPWGHAGTHNELDEFIRHYTNPAQRLRNDDVTENVDDPAFWDMYHDDMHDDVLDNLSPRLGGPRGNIDVNEIEDFLGALTDPAALNLDDTVPLTVPSGLPVDRL